MKFIVVKNVVSICLIRNEFMVLLTVGIFRLTEFEENIGTSYLQ